ncbi:MAG: hypothetical protein ACRC2M_00870 [Planktothrix sp.]
MCTPCLKIQAIGSDGNGQIDVQSWSPQNCSPKGSSLGIHSRKASGEYQTCGLYLKKRKNV